MQKKNKSLRKHLEETLNNAKRVLEKDNEELKNYALISAAFHDIGKADYRFQQYIRGKRKRSPPHPLLGLPIVDIVIKDLGIEEPYRSLIVLSVASHHTPLYENLYHDYFHTNLEVEKRAINELTDTVNDLLINIGYETKIEINNDWQMPKKILEIAKKTVITKYASEKLRDVFVKMQGCLMYADYLSSAGKDFASTVFFPRKFVNKEYVYQLRANRLKGNLFITLPTGTGKTETALYWAKNNFRESLFYILPTATTINAMYRRFKKFFKENTALYHSYADMFLFYEDENMDNLLYYKYFLYPINVTTPDQLMLSLMNYKKYTLKNYRFLKSTIIVDEIHSYDPETFFLLKYLLKYLFKKFKYLCYERYFSR